MSVISKVKYTKVVALVDLTKVISKMPKKAEMSHASRAEFNDVHVYTVGLSKDDCAYIVIPSESVYKVRGLCLMMKNEK